MKDIGIKLCWIILDHIEFGTLETLFIYPRLEHLYCKTLGIILTANDLYLRLGNLGFEGSPEVVVDNFNVYNWLCNVNVF